MPDRRVLIIGGGITGLAAAISLADDGVAVEVWEAADRLGGKIATSPFAGLDHIDEGADAYLTRVPHAVGLAERVGISETTAPTVATAAVWHHGLHDIPGGILLGVPTSVRPFVTTRLLSWRGKARAALEPLLPRRAHDDSLGSLVRARFGDEIHERLVDALIGSIYATDTDRSSLTAVPQLAALADAHRSLLIGGRALRKRAADAGPPASIFAAPRTGMQALVSAAADVVTASAGAISTGRPASRIEADGAGWRVDDEYFDAVIVASPARAAVDLLGTAAPDTANILRQIEFADVIMVRLAITGDDWPDRLSRRSGYLVPKPDQRYVTAASFGSQKWAHWQPGDGTQIVRASLGRDGLAVAHLDDEAVERHVVSDLSHHLGFDLQPTQISITRWHDAFPQYRPHHHLRVAEAESRLPRGVAVAGASYRGIGIPACIADGERAARAIKESTGTADGFLT